jgi:hypothetical protein
VKLTPRITRLELRAEFPSYTGRPATVEQLKGDALAEPMDKRLPRGTRLSFRVRSNRPLASGTLELTPILGGKKTVVTLERTGDCTVAGSFALAEPVVFTLGVTDTDGIASTAPRHGRVTLLPDRTPRVTVLQPGKHAVATPDVAIPVLVRAEDDYAVTRLIWYRGHNRSAERPRDMALETIRGPAGVEARGAFRLGDLGVKPGDVIEYFFEAVDNYPDGPNLAASRMFRVQVISVAEYDRMLRQAAARKALFETYRKLGDWLRRLAERSEALARKARELEDKGGGTPGERAALQKEAEALARDMAEYRKAVAAALKQPELFDIEKLFRQNLREQDKTLAGLHEQLQKAAGQGTPTADALGQIAQGMAGLFRKQQQEVREPLDQLVAVARLIARAQVFVRLAQEQERVVELARRFQDRRDELTLVEQRELEELGRTERRIRGELLKFLDELPDLVAQLPPGAEYDMLRDGVNSFLAGVLAEGIAEELEEATGKFLEHDGVLGAVHARTALEKMNKFISRCKAESMLGMAKQCLKFQPSLAEAMGNTLEQIVASMNSGSGGSGMDGYSMVANQMALYGPNMELMGEQGGREPATTSAVAGGPGSAADGEPEQELPTPGSPGRVKLQHDARFPLRYRDLVGEYFRAIAESQDNP